MKFLQLGPFNLAKNRDEDPDPVGSGDFWPSGSGTFSTDPDPNCNDGFIKKISS